MNWNHFILLLTGLYVGYYAINIFADFARHRKASVEDAPQDMLFFSEDSKPEIIVYEDEPAQATTEVRPANPAAQAREAEAAYPGPPLEASGAVSLKELIRVAQAGLIQYTRAIPY